MEASRLRGEGDRKGERFPAGSNANGFREQQLDEDRATDGIVVAAGAPIIDGSFLVAEGHHQQLLVEEKRGSYHVNRVYAKAERILAETVAVSGLRSPVRV